MSGTFLFSAFFFVLSYRTAEDAALKSTESQYKVTFVEDPSRSEGETAAEAIPTPVKERIK